MADTTIIGSNTSVSGRVSGDGHLSIEGRLQGSIDLSETLTVGPSGFVKADVRARTVVIDGSFDGEINAVERVVLNSTARVVAKITAPIVLMADGAQLRGELAIGDASEEASTATTRSSATTRSTTTATTRSTSSRPTASATSPAVRTTSPSSTPAPAARPAMAAAAAPTTTTTVVVEVEPEPEEEQTPEPEEASQDAPEIAEEDLDELREDYTVKELRDELRRRDLPVSGTKDELIERFLIAQAEEEHS